LLLSPFHNHLLILQTAQYLLPTLHEPSFRQDVDEVLAGSQDPVKNFQLRLVIAISMQRSEAEYASLADSYYLAALHFLNDCIQRMDLSSLQCLALIFQYSLLTPTGTAAYWVIGVALKLCQDMGLTDEATITQSSTSSLNCLEIDMRRRLFWVIIWAEFDLAHALGRPSSFAISQGHVNVKFFEMVDDCFITPDGILPGSQPIMKKRIAIHFFKLRLLRTEIVQTLYLPKHDAPVHDQDPWFAGMLAKLDHWAASCPKDDEGSSPNGVWYVQKKY